MSPYSRRTGGMIPDRSEFVGASVPRVSKGLDLNSVSPSQASPTRSETFINPRIDFMESINTETGEVIKPPELKADYDTEF